MMKAKDLDTYITYIGGTLQNYPDYGIEIPMMNSRVLQTLDALEDKWGYPSKEIISYPERAFDLLKDVHSPAFLEKIKSEPENVVLKTYELIDSDGNFHRYNPKKASRPLSEFINKAYLHILGTLMSGEKALSSGFCYHLGGGMHHAMSDSPGGFCMFNDIVVTIKELQRKGSISKALVIDTDAHKGDGTAEITQNDLDISTYSIHMKEGWPLDGSSPKSHIPSNCDIPVSLEDPYLEIHEKALESFLDSYQGDIAIVVHGADVYEHDALESSAGIKLTLEECLKRDQMTFHALKKRDIPQVWVMAGGYGSRSHEVFSNFIDYALNFYID